MRVVNVPARLGVNVGWARIILIFRIIRIIWIMRIVRIMRIMRILGGLGVARVLKTGVKRSPGPLKDLQAALLYADYEDYEDS